MTMIFISYRRSDSEFVAASIYEKLKERFGPESAFMDVHDIPLGCHFPQKLDESVAKCKVLLALIGEGWAEARFTEGPLQGQRRIDQSDDFVRIEIGSALRRNIPVIPVLIGRVTMADIVEGLPPELQGLMERHAATLRGGADLPRDLQAIFERIEAIILPGRKQRRRLLWKMAGAAMSLICVIGLGSFVYSNAFVRSPPPKFDGSMGVELLFRDKWLPNNLPVDEAVLPLKSGDKVAFEAQLENGVEGYFYVVRINSKGVASLEYPQRDQAGNIVGVEKPRGRLSGFHDNGKPIELNDSQDGIQSFVWFVRDRPLTASERNQLDTLLADLKWKLPGGWEQEKIMEFWVNGRQRLVRGAPGVPGDDQPENPKLETRRLCLALEKEGLAQYSRAVCFSFKKDGVPHLTKGDQ